MTLDLSTLSEGQRKSVLALIGGDRARTYSEAAESAGISLGSLHTYLARVRKNHPKVYERVMKVRRKRLSQRHRLSELNRKAHTRAWFRRVRRNERLTLGLGL